MIFWLRLSFFMEKAVRFKVRCTICHEVFQNDYVKKHTKCKHKDLHGTGRLAPVTIEVDQSDICQSKMDAFFCSTPDDSLSSKSAKKRKISTNVEATKLPEPEKGDKWATDQTEASA